jgi:solute carrier family 25 (mitochondrial phosphate transporter), member 3
MITHMMRSLPIAIDVVKTRIQIDPTFKGLGIISGTRQVISKEGASALLTGNHLTSPPSHAHQYFQGFGPTAVGYLAQGGAKFAGYELWKKQFVQWTGDQETAVKYRTAIYLGAASTAEYVLPTDGIYARNLTGRQIFCRYSPDTSGSH